MGDVGDEIAADLIYPLRLGDVMETSTKPPLAIGVTVT